MGGRLLTLAVVDEVAFRAIVNAGVGLWVVGFTVLEALVVEGFVMGWWVFTLAVVVEYPLSASVIVESNGDVSSPVTMTILVSGKDSVVVSEKSQSVFILNLNCFLLEQLKYSNCSRTSTKIKSGHRFSWLSRLAKLANLAPLKSRISIFAVYCGLMLGDRFILVHLKIFPHL